MIKDEDAEMKGDPDLMKMRKGVGRKRYVYKPRTRIEHLAMPTPQYIDANIAPFQSSISLTEATGLETGHYPSI